MVQAPSSMAQTAPSGGNSSISGEEASADTIPHLLLDPVFVTGKLVFKNRRERVRYTKLRRDVLKVLPYAKFAGKKYRELEYELISEKNKKEQKKNIKAIEQDIKKKFKKNKQKIK